MQMDFDIIFLDTTSAKYYDRQTLEKHALGGTEATVIRIAEGLGSLIVDEEGNRLKVAVIQSQVPYFPPTMGQFAFFLHSNDIEKTSCKHYIQIRRNLNPTLYPAARKYLWLHDVAGAEEATWHESLVNNNITLLGVSRWHRKNIIEMSKYDKVKYIYNPVPDDIYLPVEAQPKYDPNLIVWLSSPHKGLGKALELFKEVRKGNSKMQFVIFNPGYFQVDEYKLSTEPGVSYYRPTACRSMWNIVAKSLCVFYPVQWDETFGLVAAEANALGTPIATFRRAALKEVVSSENQFADDDNGIVEKVLDWSKNGRPVVQGKEEFRFSNVLLDWVGLLGEKRS